MKKLIVCMLLFGTYHLNAQTKKVLFEEFTGNTCGQCPRGNHLSDSLFNVYPNVIGVSLHTYHQSDSMYFLEIDTIDQQFAAGAPSAATDRVFNQTIWTTWPNDMQTRLAETPKVSVSLNASWNSSTRLISTNITCNILQNLTAGDYRFSLYVVEDSVIGTGPGYDQSNIENTLPGSPFFGLGDPIIGYVHRHVARALLPHSWGEAGVIPSTPTMGQSFNTSYNYTLPASYDETQIKLVAFVSAYTANHQGDEVLNAEEIDLNLTVGVPEPKLNDQISVNPNPTLGKLFVNLGEKTASSITLLNNLGQVLLTQKTSTKYQPAIDLSTYPEGIYFLQLEVDGEVVVKKVVRE